MLNSNKLKRRPVTAFALNNCLPKTINQCLETMRLVLEAYFRLILEILVTINVEMAENG